MGCPPCWSGGATLDRDSRVLPRVRKAHKGLLAEMASRAPWGSLALPDLWALLEKMVIR